MPTHIQQTFRYNNNFLTRMWANAQHDGHPAKYRWRPLFNAAVWLTPTTRVPCSNAAKTQNLLNLAGVPQTPEPISAASGPKFTILWGHVEEILLLNKFFFRLSIRALRRHSLTKLCEGAQRAIFWRLFACWIFSEPCALCSTFETCHLKFALRLHHHHVWKYGRHPICDGWD